jgi:hypothetical protein
MTIAPNSRLESIQALSKSPSTGNYCLITACRDEADYAIKTLESVVAQTVRPALWVIVDDGSKDATPKILDDYARKYPFIKVIHRPDRGVRSVGPGVVDAFYVGYDAINPDTFDYVCKFDLDLEVPPVYFEKMIERMEAEPRIGTCSGKPYFRQGDNLISEACGDEMSVGMIKFYRTACFQQIGGFVREVMWDGIDCHRCRMLGWIAVSWDAPEIQCIHLRPMGASHKGLSTGRQRHGFGQYFMGTNLFYMTASALYRMTRPPVFSGGLAMWWGYAKSMLAGKPRYNDLTFRKALRRYQWECLLLGKRRATILANMRGAALWNQRSNPPKPLRINLGIDQSGSPSASH